MPLTLGAYHTLESGGLIPADAELLYGIIYQKPVRSPRQEACIARLAGWLQPALPARMLLRLDRPITCGDSEPKPDLALVRGLEADFVKEHPRMAELVIEVSGANQDYDRSKMNAYAEARVREFWLVLVPQRQVEVHSNPLKGEYGHRSMHGPGGDVASTSIPGFRVSLEALFQD